jgi:hypothetical protein
MDTYIGNIWHDPLTESFVFTTNEVPGDFNVSTTYNQNGNVFYNPDGSIGGDIHLTDEGDARNWGVFTFQRPGSAQLDVFDAIWRNLEEFYEYLEIHGLTITEITWQRSGAPEAGISYTLSNYLMRMNQPPRPRINPIIGRELAKKGSRSGFGAMRLSVDRTIRYLLRL